MPLYDGQARAPGPSYQLKETATKTNMPRPIPCADVTCYVLSACSPTTNQRVVAARSPRWLSRFQELLAQNSIETGVQSSALDTLPER